GVIGAFAQIKGDSRSESDAVGEAMLIYSFRVTQTAPFPSSLLGAPVALNAETGVTVRGSAAGEVVFAGRPILNPGRGNSGTVSFKFNVSTSDVFLVTETVDALPDCVTSPPHCGASSVVVDPVFSFDQQSFDDFAAQRGVPSVPLDQFFTIEA